MLAIDLFTYDFDLLVVPACRTIGDFPERISNWFSNPLRWSTLWELLAFLFLVSLGMGRYSLKPSLLTQISIIPIARLF